MPFLLARLSWKKIYTVALYRADRGRLFCALSGVRHLEYGGQLNLFQKFEFNIVSII